MPKERLAPFSRALPIFADKRRRTFTIGEGIRYQPDSPPREEKLRIARELEAAMQQMAREEE